MLVEKTFGNIKGQIPKLVYFVTKLKPFRPNVDKIKYIKNIENLRYLDTLLNDIFKNFFENDLFNSSVLEANV